VVGWRSTVRRHPGALDAYGIRSQKNEAAMLVADAFEDEGSSVRAGMKCPRHNQESVAETYFVFARSRPPNPAF